MILKPYDMEGYLNQEAEILPTLITDDGVFPNNGLLPLMVYRAAIKNASGDASVFEKIIHSNKWGGSWRNGIYPFHHYHSTAHEVLGIFKGNAVVQFGGEKGELFSIEEGDVVIIPAGVSHRNHFCSQDFRVVGAYPAGESWDMNYGKEGERPEADKNIRNVPLPGTDPVFGRKGPLAEHWKKS